jgi:hypothetical protein
MPQFFEYKFVPGNLTHQFTRNLAPAEEQTIANVFLGGINYSYCGRCFCEIPREDKSRILAAIFNPPPGG